MLSWLASDFFSQSPVLLLPIIALIVFMAVFTAMAVRAWRLPDAVVADLARQPMGADTEGAHASFPHSSDPDALRATEAHHG